MADQLTYDQTRQKMIELLSPMFQRGTHIDEIIALVQEAMRSSSSRLNNRHYKPVELDYLSHLLDAMEIYRKSLVMQVG